MKASVFDGTQSVRLGGMKAQEQTPRPARTISQSSHPVRPRPRTGQRSRGDERNIVTAAVVGSHCWSFAITTWSDGYTICTSTSTRQWSVYVWRHGMGDLSWCTGHEMCPQSSLIKDETIMIIIICTFTTVSL